MAGKGPRYHSKDGHHPKDSHRSKDGYRRATTPERPGSFRPSSSKFDHDGPRSMLGPLSGQDPPMVIEQKLAMQHAEIQRLLGENQRLAVAHVALRQEFSAAQQEIMRVHQNGPFGDPEKEQRFAITQVALRQELADAKQEVNRLQEAIGTIQHEKDEHIQMTVERRGQIEAELKAAESLKADFEKLRYEKDELVTRVNHLTEDVKKLPAKDQEIASLKSEIDELRQRHQQARMNFEHQKKINLESLEQKQAMEKDTFSKARELDKLRAELMAMERKLHGANLAQSNGSAPLHNSGLRAGSFENNNGGQQDVPKSIKQNLEPSESKSNMESMKLRTGVDALQPGTYVPQDHLSSNAQSAGEWIKQSGPNGKSLNYNGTSGASQWNKPALNTVSDLHVLSNYRQMPQTQGQIGQNAGSEHALLATPERPPLPLPPPLIHQQQPSQQVLSSLTMPQFAMQQLGQHSLTSYGVNLLVLGLSEGITDRDLANLFHPYGSILYAKVTMDAKSGPAEYYGVVTMENQQIAEAAANAVNGMFILGKQIKVEVQIKEQSTPSQKGYPQYAMQQGMMQGIGPGRWQQRPASAAGGGRWPY